MHAETSLLKRLEADEVRALWVIYHDYSGRACAKVVPRERFAAVSTRGVVFAKANLSMRLDDQQTEYATFLADSGDFLATADESSYALVGHRPGTARVHTFMRADDGGSWEGCPRSRLQSMCEAYAERGFYARVGFEPECILLEPGDDGEYGPVDSDGMFTLRGLDRHHELWQAVIADLGLMGIEVDQLGKEYGPGQYEGTTGYTSPIAACDRYLSYKEVVRARAAERGLLASFMPKPFAHLPGSGLHVHLSLWDADGRERSCGDDGSALSELGRCMVAGLLRHAPALSGVGCPTVNSYKRLQPGSWAPAHVCWGLGNRAALIRVPGAGPRRHLEYRLGDNAVNPFVYLTALLAAALDGLDNRLTPPASIDDVDVGHLSDTQARARSLERLPRTLGAALDALEADTVISTALGPTIGAEHLKLKRSELEAYEQHVHPWERRLYLESI